MVHRQAEEQRSRAQAARAGAGEESEEAVTAVPFSKTCKGCGVLFDADRRRRDFHSRACWAGWRERQPAWQAAKRRGQLKSARTQREKSIVLCAKKAAASTSKGDAFRTGYRDGYRLGWKRGERVGFASGYEAAVQDMDTRRSA
jgi:hypothetical protein